MRAAFVLLGMALGCPALALTPQQQAVLAPSAACAAPAGVQAGDLICPAITPDGWHLTGVLYRVAPARALSAYTLAPGASPAVTLAVVSPGYDATGAPTTVSRTVQATIPQRLPYPSDTLPNEVQTPLGVQVLLALSDWVNAGDTATVTALAGAYMSGGLSSTVRSGMAVANRSAKRHDRPICAWVSEGWQRIVPGGTLLMEAVCLHARPRAGRQVAAVVMTAIDTGGHTASCTSAGMTQSARVTGGNPVPVYSCGIAIPATGWSAGSLTVDLAAYPFVGDQATTASGGADGVPVAAGTRSPNLHPLVMQLDTGTAYAPAYAWVQPAGTCLGAGCTSSVATDPGTGNAANYPTVYRAMLGCQAFNASRGHTDAAGCVVRLRAGTYASYETSFAYSQAQAPQYTGATWATVEAAPGETPSTVTVISTGSYPLVRDRWRFRGVGFLPSTATATLAAHAIIQGPDSTPANPVTTEVLFDNCVLTTKTAYPLLYGVGQVHFYNSTLDQSAGQGSLVFPYSIQRFAAGVVAGNVLRGTGAASSASAVAAVGLIAGNQSSGLTLLPMPTGATLVQPTGPINLANKWMQAPVLHDLRNLGWPANYAAVQNVYEKTGADGQLGYGFLNDSDLSPFTNYVRQYETVVGDPTGSGGRSNLMYNDVGSGAVSKLGVALFNLDQNRNSKRDTFDNPTVHQQPGRVGAWAWDAAVGHLGDVAGGTVGPNANCTAGSTCWIGEFLGPLGATNATIAFANNQSVAPNTGGGDYHLAASSPAASRVPAGLAALPFDLGGTARRNDGTGAAGAYEGGQ